MDMLKFVKNKVTGTSAGWSPKAPVARKRAATDSWSDSEVERIKSTESSVDGSFTELAQSPPNKRVKLTNGNQSEVADDETEVVDDGEPAEDEVETNEDASETSDNGTETSDDAGTDESVVCNDTLNGGGVEVNGAMDDDKVKVAANSSSSSSNETLQLTCCAQSADQGQENYLRGAFWHPNGHGRFITCSHDNVMRLYQVDEPLLLERSTASNGDRLGLDSQLSVRCSDTVYDFSWMRWPEKTAFVTTGRDCPIHLYDVSGVLNEQSAPKTANDNDSLLAGTFKVKNHLDELAPARSVGCSVDGQKLYAAVNNTVFVFDPQRPSAMPQRREPSCHFISQQGSLISCIAPSPNSFLYACGTFDGTVAIYAEPDGSSFAMMRYTPDLKSVGGVTWMRFSNDANCLIVGGRKNPYLVVWDLRNCEQELYRFRRSAETNQRLYFDVTPAAGCASDTNWLLSGDKEGRLLAFNLDDSSQTDEAGPTSWLQASSDALNSVSCHPDSELPLLLTGSGQRHFNDGRHSSEENVVKIWSYARCRREVV